MVPIKCICFLVNHWLSSMYTHTYIYIYMCFMLVNYNYIYIYILIHIYWYYIGYISITESVLWLFIWRWNFAQATTRPMCDRWSKPRWIDVEGICFFVKTSVSGWWKRVVSMSNMYIYIYIYIYTLESYILSLYVYVYIYIYTCCIFTENAGTKWMFVGYPANKLEFAYEATIINTWQFLVFYPPVA